MPVIALIAASALAAAEWRTPVVADADYPGRALLKEKSAVTTLEILIDPSGKVVKCAALNTVGDAQLASDMCSIAKRKKAVPARDEAGKPAFGFRRDFASLILPGTPQAEQIGEARAGPDIDIEVASGITSPVLVRVTIAVDKSGKTTGCEYGKSASVAAFGAVACKQLGQMEFDKLTDAGGAPVSYIRPVTVRFLLAKAGA